MLSYTKMNYLPNTHTAEYTIPNISWATIISTHFDPPPLKSKLKYVLLLNQIRCPFCHGIKSAGQVAAKLKWHNRSVNDSHVFSAINLEVRTNDAAFLPRKH